MKYLSFLFIFFSGIVNSTNVDDVGIRYVGMYGNGKVFASLDKVIPVANCETATWVVIPDDHLKKAEFYSMLLMAFAAGKKLDINSTSCHSGQATITKGSTDYILVK